MPHKKKPAPQGKGPHKTQPKSVDTQLQNDLTEVEHLIEKVTINITSGKETPEEILQMVQNMLPTLVIELQKIAADANKRPIAPKKEVYGANEHHNGVKQEPLTHIDSEVNATNFLQNAIAPTYGAVTATSPQNTVPFDLEKKQGDKKAEEIFDGVTSVISGILDMAAAIAYLQATGGIGAAIGGGALLLNSISEVGIGIAQIYDASVNKDPNEKLEKSSNLLGLLAHLADSKYADNIDLFAGLAMTGFSAKTAEETKLLIEQNKNLEEAGKKALSTLIKTPEAKAKITKAVIESYSPLHAVKEAKKEKNIVKKAWKLIEAREKKKAIGKVAHILVSPETKETEKENKTESKKESKTETEKQAKETTSEKEIGQKTKNKKQNKGEKITQERKQQQNKKPTKETASTTKYEETQIFKHTVIGGEHLYSIAKAWNTTEDELRSQNNLSLNSDGYLKIGQEIIYVPPKK